MSDLAGDRLDRGLDGGLAHPPVRRVRGAGVQGGEGLGADGLELALHLAEPALRRAEAVEGGLGVENGAREALGLGPEVLADDEAGRIVRRAVDAVGRREALEIALKHLLGLLEPADGGERGDVLARAARTWGGASPGIAVRPSIRLNAPRRRIFSKIRAQVKYRGGAPDRHFHLGRACFGLRLR